MSREIKFRVWVPKRGKRPAFMSMPFAVGKPTTLFGDEIVMQFTGLKDAKGRGIYEGDVIEGPEFKHRHVITWIEGEAGFGCYIPPLQSFQVPSAGLRQSWITEFDKAVIGNIYENPDLVSPASDSKSDEGRGDEIVNEQTASMA